MEDIYLNAGCSYTSITKYSFNTWHWIGGEISFSVFSKLPISFHMIMLQEI
jgi:hypothetical protein